MVALGKARQDVVVFKFAMGWARHRIAPGSSSFARQTDRLWWWFRKRAGARHRRSARWSGDELCGGTSSASVMRGRAAACPCVTGEKRNPEVTDSKKLGRGVGMTEVDAKRYFGALGFRPAAVPKKSSMS